MSIDEKNRAALVARAAGGIDRMEAILMLWKAGREAPKAMWLNEPSLQGLRDVRTRGVLDDVTSIRLGAVQSQYELLSNQPLSERTAALQKKDTNNE